MHPILLGLLLVPSATSAPGAPSGPAATYHTAKALPALETCLTESLSTRGEITAVNSEGIVTLMLSASGKTPMLIDLAPPKVTVTTKFARGTRKLLEACL